MRLLQLHPAVALPIDEVRRRLNILPA